ncbi:MAG TPA: prepilin-type N-terminal cleavage/methylation domain-containing protein [Candidatus Xenobia bacterium]|jgi:prepilin-type N-terminal cleavage/methylation domain-containing protein
MTKKPLTGRGFTLIECIVACAVIVLGFLAVASVFPASMRGAAADLNHTTAVRLAQNTLDAIRSHPFGTALPANLLYTAANPFLAPKVVEGGAGQATAFTTEVAFQNGFADGSQPNPNDADFDVAVITVHWSEGTGSGAHTLDKTFVMEGGISRVP